MSRIFWDTMLFVYLLEDNKQFASRVRTLLQKSYQRGDQLLTSYLALAEMLVGSKAGGTAAQTVIETIEEMGFTFVEFNEGCVEPFRMLRSKFGLRSADSMHLACAAAARTDLFLTGDEQLIRKSLHVPGIHFVVHFENAPL